MPNLQTENWENDFEEKFPKLCHLGHYEYLGEVDSAVCTNEVKSFITSLLKKKDEEVIKKIDEAIEDNRKVRNNYDGNELESACKYHRIKALNWDEILRYEQGKDKALDDLKSLLTTPHKEE